MSPPSTATGCITCSTPLGCGFIQTNYSVVAINNLSKFGVDRKVSYYRPEAERVGTGLNKTFFPGAELEPAPRLADNIDVKGVLGHDLGPQQPAEAQQAPGPRP